MWPGYAVILQKKQVPRKSETTQLYLFTLRKVDLYIKFTDREQYNIH